jgi:hypothetical protein
MILDPFFIDHFLGVENKYDHAHQPKKLSQSSDDKKPQIKASTTPTINWALRQKYFYVITDVQRESCIKN